MIDFVCVPYGLRTDKGCKGSGIVRLRKQAGFGWELVRYRARLIIKWRINLEVAFALLHKHRLVLDESLSFAHTIRGKSVLRGVGKKDWGLEGKGEGHCVGLQPPSTHRAFRSIRRSIGPPFEPSGPARWLGHRGEGRAEGGTSACREGGAAPFRRRRQSSCRGRASGWPWPVRVRKTALTSRGGSLRGRGPRSPGR